MCFVYQEIIHLFTLSFRNCLFVSCTNSKHLRKNTSCVCKSKVIVWRKRISIDFFFSYILQKNFQRSLVISVLYNGDKKFNKTLVMWLRKEEGFLLLANEKIDFIWKFIYYYFFEIYLTTSNSSKCTCIIVIYYFICIIILSL